MAPKGSLIGEKGESPKLKQTWTDKESQNEKDKGGQGEAQMGEAQMINVYVITKKKNFWQKGVNVIENLIDQLEE